MLRIVLTPAEKLRETLRAAVAEYAAQMQLSREKTGSISYGLDILAHEYLELAEIRERAPRYPRAAAGQANFIFSYPSYLSWGGKTLGFKALPADTRPGHTFGDATVIEAVVYETGTKIKPGSPSK